ALGRITLENKAVEAVEGIERRGPDERQPAALWGVRIDVREMRKAGRIVQLAEWRQSMPGLGVSRGACKKKPDCGQRENGPFHSLGTCAGFFAAPLAADHQTWRNEDDREGSFAGRANLSQNAMRSYGEYHCGTT